MDNLEAEREKIKSFFEANFKESQKDEFSSFTKDSSLKRASALIRKLKQFSCDQTDQLIDEIKKLNLSMHLNELTDSILQIRPKNSMEYIALVKIIVQLFIETPELRPFLFKELWKNITSMIESNNLNPSEKNSFSNFRCLFRLSCELHNVRAFNCSTRIISVLNKLFGQENEDEKASEFIPFVSYLLKTFTYWMLPKLETDDSAFNGFLTEFREDVERRARKFYEQKGDLFSDFEKELLTSHKNFETLNSSLFTLASLLSLKLPEFKGSAPQFQILEGKIFFTSQVKLLNASDSSIYIDEEERNFYETLPDLTNLSTNPNIDPSFVYIPESKDDKDDETVIKSLDPNVTQKKKLPKDIERFFENLSQVNSVSMADLLSAEIVTSNMKFDNYFEVFFDISRTKNDLIRYIARIVASIKNFYPKLVEDMASSISGQFHFLTKCKEPIIGTRRRVCRFISEFTKFKLISQTTSFNFIKKCVKEFIGPNIDMTCFLLESIGRFLFLQPESHARIKHLIKIVENFRKSSLNISTDKNIQLANAIFFIDPKPMSSPTASINKDDLFLRFALDFYFKGSRTDDLSELRKFIRSVDWNDSAFVKCFQELFVDPGRLDAISLTKLPILLREIQKQLPAFVIETLDLLVSECTLDLSTNTFINSQQAMARSSFLGSLFDLDLIPTKTFICYLYQCITETYHASKVSDKKEKDRMNVDRIVHVCTTLNSLKAKGNKDTEDVRIYLKEFLPFFRCYLTSNDILDTVPKEVFEVIMDIFKKFDSCLMPLNTKEAISDFKNYPSYGLFENVMITLNIISASGSDKCDERNDVDFGKKKPTSVSVITASELAEIDKEYSKIIGQDLDSRKLEKRPQTFEFSIQLIKGAGSSSSAINATKNNSITPSILLKKKKKAVLKPLF